MPGRLVEWSRLSIACSMARIRSGWRLRRSISVSVLLSSIQRRAGPSENPDATGVDQLAVARRGGKLVDADWLSWRDVDVATMTYSAAVAVVFAPLVVGVVVIAAYSRRARRRRS